MRVTKISLATLVALGALTCANAETKLEDAIKGTTISGYALGQLTSMFGDDASGTAFRSRVFANINTGSVGGFSVRAAGYATMGGGAPNGGSFLANSTNNGNGNVADVLSVGVMSLYGNMNFAEYGSKTTIIGGKMNILTAFNDTTWDHGYGIYISNEDIEGVKFSAQAFGAWSLDNNDMNSGTDTFNSENGLYILGVEAGGERLAGAKIKLYAGTSTKTIDYMVAADVSYTISGITLQSQVAVMDVDTSSAHFAKTDAFKQDVAANLRGLYNIQASYANKDLGFSAKAGFTGSFGDGYGALLNGASFNMGGQFWYDTLANGANGYSLTGSGGYKETVIGTTPTTKNTSIMVGYVGVQYTGVKSLKLGLDYAYVGGDNNYTLMKKGVATQTQNNGIPTTHMNATFHEVSFTASYGFFDNKLTLAGLIGSTFGDLQMARGRMLVKYSF